MIRASSQHGRYQLRFFDAVRPATGLRQRYVMISDPRDDRPGLRRAAVLPKWAWDECRREQFGNAVEACAVLMGSAYVVQRDDRQTWLQAAGLERVTT